MSNMMTLTEAIFYYGKGVVRLTVYNQRYHIFHLHETEFYTAKDRNFAVERQQYYEYNLGFIAIINRFNG